MRHKFLQLVHNDYVRSIKFNKFNKTIISSSSDMKKPLIIMDPEGKKKTYIFELGKVTKFKIFLNKNLWCSFIYFQRLVLVLIFVKKCILYAHLLRNLQYLFMTFIILPGRSLHYKRAMIVILLLAWKYTTLLDIYIRCRWM